MHCNEKEIERERERENEEREKAMKVESRNKKCGKITRKERDNSTCSRTIFGL